MPRKLLVFDLDGTLVDTLPTLTESMNAALAECAFPAISNAYVCASLGNGMLNLCRRCLPKEHRDDEAVYLPFLEKYKAAYAKNYLCADRPYDGLGEVIAELSRRGYTLACLSNKPHAYTTDIVESVFGKDRFAAVQGKRDGVPLKPDPESLLSIASSLGFAPADVYMIGDSEPDVEVAANAGVCSIAVSWGYRTRDALVAVGARVFADKPSDLLTILK